MKCIYHNMIPIHKHSLTAERKEKSYFLDSILIFGIQLFSCMRAENDPVTGLLGIGRAANGWLTRVRNTIVSRVGLMTVTPRTVRMAAAELDMNFNILRS